MKTDDIVTLATEYASNNYLNEAMKSVALSAYIAGAQNERARASRFMVVPAMVTSDGNFARSTYDVECSYKNGARGVENVCVNVDSIIICTTVTHKNCEGKTLEKGFCIRCKDGVVLLLRADQKKLIEELISAKL